MAGSILNRILLFFLLFTVIKNTVDFSVKEFDPLRDCIDVSIDKITSTQYYNEYISPLSAKYQPVLNNLQSKYIIPTYESANSFAIDKYQTLMSKHVNTAVSYITTNTAYEKLLSFTPLIMEYYNISIIHFKYVIQESFQYLAIGFTYVEKYAQVCFFQGFQFFKSSNLFFNNQLAILTPVAIELYEDSILPGLETLKEATINGFYTTMGFLSSFYNAHVDPFAQTQIVPRLSLFYKQYFAKYAQIIKFQVDKYYMLFKVKETLSLSKTLLSNSYDHMLSCYQNGFFKVPINSTFVTIEEANEFTDIKTLKTEEIPIITQAENIESKTQSIDEEFEIPTESESFSLLKIKNKLKEDKNEIVLSLFEEIANWKTLVHENIDNIIKNFNNTVEKLESEALVELIPKIRELLRELTEHLSRDYSEVNKQINNIDSKEVELENGEVANLNKDGKIFYKKVTREEFRAYLNEAKEFAPIKSDEIWEIVKDKINQLEADINEERKIIVNIYQEFAEVSIDEFSKKMMYSSFSNNFNKVQQALENGEEDLEIFKDWEEYIKVKNYLTKEREDLISKSQELTTFKKYLNEIQITLQTLVAEAGNFYALARARANIEFQTREAVERELDEKFNSNETVTITSSVLKVVSLTQGKNDEVEATTTVNIEISEEDKINDHEEEQVSGHKGETYETYKNIEKTVEVKKIEEFIPKDISQVTPETTPESSQDIIEHVIEDFEESSK